MFQITNEIDAKNVVALANEIENVQFNITRKQFEYELNEKASKQKLIKGAKRNPLEIVENSNSTNLVFSVGAWYQVVLPCLKY